MKKFNFIHIILFLVLFSICTKSAHASWWNDSWKYRKQLTFQNSAQNENLTDFPVLVKLTSANFDFSKAQSTGYDIRFLDTDGNTELPYEIEKWDASAQEGYIWVKIPQIDASSNSDYIYMYYGNASAVNAQSTINVWNSNFLGVWHLKENPTTQVNDSTFRGISLANKGSLTSANQISGFIDGALYMNNDVANSNYYVTESDLNPCTEGSATSAFQFSPTQDFTISAWINSTSTRYYEVIVGNSGINYRQFRLLLDAPDQGGRIWFQILADGSSGGTSGSVHSSTVVNDGNWHYITGTRINKKLTIYVDGIAEDTTTVASNPNLSGACPLAIGSDFNRYFQYTGKIDEARISTIAYSPTQVAAEYKSQNNTLINYSAEDTYTHSTANTQYVFQSSTEKQICSNTPPSAIPDLFQINTTKNTATLYFTPAGNPHNSYTISYGYDDNIERFGTGFSKQSSDGVQSYTINALSPNTKYFFKIKANNGCMPGPWSRTMMVKTGYSNSGFMYYAYSPIINTLWR